MSYDTGAMCSICAEKRAVSREGWCMPCLRAKLNEKFGKVPTGHVGERRTKEMRQARDDDSNPWRENAIRVLEDG